MKILVSYSGGKDSQACLINAIKEYGADKVTAVFCDTGWEHPDTYTHIHRTTESLNVNLVTLKSKFDFVSLAVWKKRFPSPNARFCTSELKMKPMIDYILSLKESCIIIQGIRAGESNARAKMLPECMYFQTYFQPKEVKKNPTGPKKSASGAGVTMLPCCAPYSHGRPGKSSTAYSPLVKSLIRSTTVVLPA